MMRVIVMLAQLKHARLNANDAQKRHDVATGLARVKCQPGYLNRCLITRSGDELLCTAGFLMASSRAQQLSESIKPLRGLLGDHDMDIKQIDENLAIAWQHVRQIEFVLLFI